MKVNTVEEFLGLKEHKKPNKVLRILQRVFQKGNSKKHSRDLVKFLEDVKSMK